MGIKVGDLVRADHVFKGAVMRVNLIGNYFHEKGRDAQVTVEDMPDAFTFWAPVESLEVLSPVEEIAWRVKHDCI